MNTDSNLVKARSSIVWILAILVAFGSVWWIEKESGKALIAKAQAPASASASTAANAAAFRYTSEAHADPAARPLTAEERQWARIAWTYFENNTDRSTGLVNSVDGFPSTTLWDVGSSLMAMISARRLELLSQAAFDQRVTLLLASLASMPLAADALPNKAYNVRTLAMTDYKNQSTPTGTGWSAIDLGRLDVALNMLVWQHPQHTHAVRAVLGRWDLKSLSKNGQLVGMEQAEGQRKIVQEGRLGYEQYAAGALASLGVDTEEASRWLSHLRWVGVEGVEVPADSREPARFGAIDPVLSEPYILLGLESGWSRTAREFAWRVYQAQEARFTRTGIATAVSEDHVDQAPYFVYYAVHAAGKPWTAVSSEGEELPALRSLSSKAAFGWHALMRTPYTERLMREVATLNDPAKGWFAGRYEADARPNRSINVNTNAVVLESLAYIAQGRLARLP